MKCAQPELSYQIWIRFIEIWRMDRFIEMWRMDPRSFYKRWNKKFSIINIITLNDQYKNFSVNDKPSMALFAGLVPANKPAGSPLEIQPVSAVTVFFSHNKPAGTVFFSQVSDQRTRPKL